MAAAAPEPGRGPCSQGRFAAPGLPAQTLPRGSRPSTCLFITVWESRCVRSLVLQSRPLSSRCSGDPAVRPRPQSPFLLQDRRIRDFPFQWPQAMAWRCPCFASYHFPRSPRPSRTRPPSPLLAGKDLSEEEKDHLFLHPQWDWYGFSKAQSLASL